MKMPTDYGAIELHLVESPEDFWALWDELLDDKSGFIHNRACLLDGYKNESMFSLKIEETDSMFRRGANTDEIFCKTEHRTLYMIPCLCILNKKGTEIEIIWVHSRLRRKGLATKMIELLMEFDDTKLIPNHPLPDSLPFWKAVGLLDKDYEIPKSENYL